MKHSFVVGLKSLCLLLLLQSSMSTVTAKTVSDTTSYLQTINIATGKLDTLLTVNYHIEAPNWHPNGYLIYNSYGKLYTFDLSTKKVKQLNTGFAQANNNDHGFSPDGKWLAISHADQNDPSPKQYKSIIYVLPIEHSFMFEQGEEFDKIVTTLIKSYKKEK